PYPRQHPFSPRARRAPGPFQPLAQATANRHHRLLGCCLRCGSQLDPCVATPHSTPVHVPTTAICRSYYAPNFPVEVRTLAPRALLRRWWLPSAACGPPRGHSSRSTRTITSLRAFRISHLPWSRSIARECCILLACILCRGQLTCWRQFSPFQYRLGMQTVVAVGIEPEAMAERRLLRELCCWHDLEVVDQSAVRLIQCAQ